MDRNIAAFLREDARTVNVAFWGNAKEYTYIADFPVAVGDWVVVTVGAENEPKVVTVMEVHDGLQIEPNDPTKYKWCIGKVNREAYEASMRRNTLIERTVGKGYAASMRRQFAQALLTSLPEETQVQLREAITGGNAPKAGGDE